MSGNTGEKNFTVEDANLLTKQRSNAEKIAMYTPNEIVWFAIKIGGALPYQFGLDPRGSDRCKKAYREKTHHAHIGDIMARAMRENSIARMHSYNASVGCAGRDSMVRTPTVKRPVTVVSELSDAFETLSAMEESDKPDEVFSELDRRGTFLRGTSIAREDTEADRKRRYIGAIANDVIDVNRNNSKVTQAVSSTDKAISSMSLENLSATIAEKFVNADGCKSQTFLYDLVQKSKHVYPWVTNMVNTGLGPKYTHNMFKTEVVINDEVPSEVATLVKYKAPFGYARSSNPELEVARARSFIQRRGIGVVGSQLLDGLPINSHMRNIVNDSEDIVIPPDVSVVVLNSSGEDVASHVFKREMTRKSLVIFYKVKQLDSRICDEYYCDGQVQKNGICKYVYGRLPEFSEDTKVLYVDLAKRPCKSTKGEVLSDIMARTALNDSREWHEVMSLNYDYYLLKCHVLSCSESIRGEDGQLKKGYFPEDLYYYVSNRFVDLNVVVSNYDFNAFCEIQSIPRRELVPVYAYIYHRYISYPINRWPMSRLTIPKYFEKGNFDCRLIRYYRPLFFRRRVKQMFRSNIGDEIEPEFFNQFSYHEMTTLLPTQAHLTPPSPKEEETEKPVVKLVAVQDDIVSTFTEDDYFD